ncbi:hypothetical protein QTP88_007774 [Uroleucon formosanum]
MTIHDDDNRTAGKMCNLTRNGGHTISAAALDVAGGYVHIGDEQRWQYATTMSIIKYEKRNNERTSEKERGGGSECENERDGRRMKGYNMWYVHSNSTYTL